MQWQVSADCLTQIQNIEKAQKEIDRLEKEALEASTSFPLPKADRGRIYNHGKKSEATNEGANGDASAEEELAQEQDANDDVAEEMQQASLEDKAE